MDVTADGVLNDDPPMPSLLGCVLTLAAVTALLRIVGLKRSVAVGRRLSARASFQTDASDEFTRAVARKVDIAAAFFPGRALCLEQSLALHIRLRRLGIPTALRLGVQPYPFAAHAWVEYRGEPVGESRDRVQQYVPLPDLDT